MSIQHRPRVQVLNEIPWVRCVLIAGLSREPARLWNECQNRGMPWDNTCALHSPEGALAEFKLINRLAHLSESEYRAALDLLASDPAASRPRDSAPGRAPRHLAPLPPLFRRVRHEFPCRCTFAGWANDYLPRACGRQISAGLRVCDLRCGPPDATLDGMVRELQPLPEPEYRAALELMRAGWRHSAAIAPGSTDPRPELLEMLISLRPERHGSITELVEVARELSGA